MIVTNGNGQVVLVNGNVLSVPASQNDIDSIAGLVGGITTPSTPADIEAQTGDLIADANEVTGESDVDLTSAVGTLIDGYGQGGGAATQEELDSIAGLVGGIETPSTPEAIQSQESNLIATANEATGETDETIEDAIGSLISSHQYPDEYVTNGLYFWLDAVDNQGDHHDADATSWIDKIGGIAFEQMDEIAPQVGSNYIHFTEGNRRYHNSTDALSLAEPVYCEFVVQITRNGSTQIIVQRADGTTSGRNGNGYAIYHDDVNACLNSGANSAGLQVNTGYAETGKVFTFGGTKTNGIMRNGVIHFPTQNTTNRTNSQSNFIIGGYTSNTFPFDGYLCSVRYYSRILTTDEIAQNYAQDVKRYGAGKPVDTSEEEDDPPREIISADDLDVSAVVSYFQEPVLDAVRHMESLGDGWTHFAAISDCHYDKNYRHGADMLSALYDCGRVERLIFLGDMDDGYDATGYGNWKSDYEDLFSKSLFLQGNHDIKLVTNATWYDDVFSEMSRARFGSISGLYYYIDFPSKAIRLICCNGNDQTATQKLWAKSALKNAPSNYTVFVLQHQPFLNYSTGGVPFGGVRQTIDPEVLAADDRFGTIICGHAHVDDATVDDNGVRQDVLISDGYKETSHDESVGQRVDGTTTAQAITIISINTTQKLIQFYRIGAEDNALVSWTNHVREVSYDRTEAEV